jgi:hypothetical protein
VGVEGVQEGYFIVSFAIPMALWMPAVGVEHEDHGKSSGLRCNCDVCSGALLKDGRFVFSWFKGKG